MKECSLCLSSLFDVCWRLESLIVTVCIDWPPGDIPATPEYLASTSLYHLLTADILFGKEFSFKLAGGDEESVSCDRGQCQYYIESLQAGRSYYHGFTESQTNSAVFY